MFAVPPFVRFPREKLFQLERYFFCTVALLLIVKSIGGSLDAVLIPGLVVVIGIVQNEALSLTPALPAILQILLSPYFDLRCNMRLVDKLQ